MLELLGGLFSCIVVFLVFNWVGLGDVNWPPWYYLVTGAGLCLSLFIYEALTLLGQGKKVAAYFSSIWFYIFAMFSYWALFRPATAMYIPAQQMMLQFFPSQGLICFLVLTLFILTLVRHRQHAVYWALIFCGFIHAATLLVHNFTNTTGVEQMGLLGNRSLGASFVVIWVTLLPRWKKFKFWEQEHVNKDCKILARYMFGIGALAVLSSRSSISYLALCMVFASWMFSYGWRKYSPGVAIWSVIGVMSVCFITLSFIDPEIFALSSRAVQWPIFYTEWVRGPGSLFGLGPSNMQFYLPMWQAKYNLLHGGSRENTFWLWVHNDFFQFLMEYGLLGFMLFSSLFIVCLKRAWREPALFASVVAIGVVMFGNYPWHIAATTLICTFVLWECVTIKDTENETTRPRL